VCHLLDVEAVFEEMMADVRRKQPAAHIWYSAYRNLCMARSHNRHDAEFGPMVLFAWGGIFVEILRDVAYRLVPASTGVTPYDDREVRGYQTAGGRVGKGGCRRGGYNTDIAGGSLAAC